MPSRKELVAYGRDETQIAQTIGADLVIFQTLFDLEESVRSLNPDIKTFDCSVFTGKYVTGGVGEGYLQHLEGLRSDNNRGNLDLTTNTLQSKGDNGFADGQATGNNSPTHANGADNIVGLHNTWRST